MNNTMTRATSQIVIERISKIRILNFDKCEQTTAFLLEQQMLTMVIFHPPLKLLGKSETPP